MNFNTEQRSNNFKYNSNIVKPEMKISGLIEMLYLYTTSFYPQLRSYEIMFVLRDLYKIMIKIKRWS